jgi:hypothetical protein
MQLNKNHRMSIKEAVLKSLEDIQRATNYLEVYNNIISKRYYDFGSAKTPTSTVSAQLGNFIRHGDARVKRINQSGGTYSYYLTKVEQNIGLEALVHEIDSELPKKEKKKTYTERDLHILLSSYLKSIGIYSKTIFHEQSTYNKDNNQTWSHPDMVGTQFINLHTKASQNFLKAIKSVETLKLTSYEIKKEVNNDSELKKAFFQAVSNSSWANYGYLVAFEFSDNLREEMKRLNESFGIGIIKLSSNPYESQELLQPKYRDLDIKTLDKLCRINKEFEIFIENVEKLITSEERYYKSTEKELDDFCDPYFSSDSQADQYCKEKHIPTNYEL